MGMRCVVENSPAGSSRRGWLHCGVRAAMRKQPLYLLLLAAQLALVGHMLSVPDPGAKQCERCTPCSGVALSAPCQVCQAVLALVAMQPDCAVPSPPVPLVTAQLPPPFGAVPAVIQRSYDPRAPPV